MKTKQTFDDGSWIETCSETGNKTVFGKQAHRAYFEGLRAVKITKDTPVAVVSYCMDADGTRKAELIRRANQNPITQKSFGAYGFELWTADSPNTVTRFASEKDAKRAFKSAMLHGTNP